MLHGKPSGCTSSAVAYYQHSLKRETSNHQCRAADSTACFQHLCVCVFFITLPRNQTVLVTVSSNGNHVNAYADIFAHNDLLGSRFLRHWKLRGLSLEMRLNQQRPDMAECAKVHLHVSRVRMSPAKCQVLEHELM